MHKPSCKCNNGNRVTIKTRILQPACIRMSLNQ